MENLLRIAAEPINPFDELLSPPCHSKEITLVTVSSIIMLETW
jgi:hypothetical protein